METQIGEKVIVAKPCGDIDIVNADEFKQEVVALYDREQKDIVFDCQDLKFLDSTALGVLVAINNHMIRDGKHISLFGLKGRLVKLFRITGLDRVIPVSEEAYQGV